MSSYQGLFFGNSIEKHWNLVEIVDESRKPTEFIAVRGEIRSRLGEQCLLRHIMMYGKKLIGLCSYQEFPRQYCNPHDSSRHTSYRFIEKFGDNVLLWCHCFRDPWNYFPMNVPALLYSESDQYAHSVYLHGLVGTVEKKYDFFVSIQEGEWNNHIRGISIARRWIEVMADQMGLKILVCGNNRRKDFPFSSVDVIDFQKWSDFVQCMNSAKALFCTSVYDASPRIIVESLSLDMPVLLNNKILGGWKYIGDETGLLFDPDLDTHLIPSCVESFLEAMRKGQYHPLEYSRATFDDVHANARFLADHVRAITSLQYETLVEGWIYINLDDRLDRRREMEQEFRRMKIETVHRIAATKDEQCGHLGCAKSHLQALALARQKGWKRFIILEDDFRFGVNKQQLLYTLHTFFEYLDRHQKKEGSVFMLAHYYLIEETMPFPMLIRRVLQGTTTAGYLVCDGEKGNGMIQKLADTFQNAQDNITSELHVFLANHPDKKKMMETPHAIDQQWIHLQKKGYFFTSDPVVGQQDFRSPSSIMKPL